MCNQTTGLVARALEETGIATVTISLLREVTEKVVPPRALYVPFGFGYPLGEAGNHTLQKAIIRKALEMIESVQIAGEIREY